MKRVLSVLLAVLILCGTIPAIGASTSGDDDVVFIRSSGSDKENPVDGDDLIKRFSDNDNRDSSGEKETWDLESFTEANGNNGFDVDQNDYPKKSDDIYMKNGKKSNADLAPIGEGNQAPVAPSYVDHEAIVHFKGALDIESLGEGITVKKTYTLSGGEEKLINVAVVNHKTLSTDELVKRLSTVPSVDTVEPNYLKKVTALTNDAYAPYQWALQNTGQNNGVADYDTNPETLWNNVPANGEECVVAIIDTGVDINHEDLKSVLWKNNVQGLEGYGTCGYDFSGSVPSHQPIDDNGHGTHLAGIIAAQANNSIGISGINKANVKIMMLKTNNGRNIVADAEERAFDYIKRAKRAGVNIVAVNCSFGGLMSLSGLSYYDNLFDELGKMGIVTCVAAGNESKNIDYVYNDTQAYLPAATMSDYAITVGAIAEDGYLASFSNYGEGVDIAAPGTAILSAVNTDTYEPSIYDSATLSRTTRWYQAFDDGVEQSELFGNISTWKDYYGPEGLSLSEESFFGRSGYSLAVSTGANRQGKIVLFSIPYTLSSSTSSYDLTFHLKGQTIDGSDCTFYLLDKPESNDALDAVQLVGFSPDWDWDRVSYHIDPYSTKDSESVYQRSTNRELVIAIVPKTNKSATVFIDSFGISKQDISTSLYGKYGFKRGTSQATPYVAGAVALVSSAYPSIDAAAKINAILKAGRFDEHLEGAVKDQLILDLKNISKYVPSTPTVIQPTGVTVKPEQAEIDIGGTVQLSATVAPSNATNKTVTWSSSNDTIAAVSSNGLVTGKAPGTVTITAKTSNGKTATATVKVKQYAVAPTGISIKPEKSEIEIGDSVRLLATVSPSNASDKTVKWSSSNDKIAEVSSTGLVTGKNDGTVTIIAETVNGLRAYAEVTVKRGEILPTAVSVKPETSSISVGQKLQLSATIEPANATTKSVTWSSSNTTIASVSTSGVVTGKAAGTAIITVKTANGKQATATIKVESTTVMPTGITIEPESAVISVNETLTLTAKITPANATNKKVTWTSSDSSIAAVSSSGTVLGKSAGTVTIFARTENGKTANCRLTVKYDQEKIYQNNIDQLKKHIRTHYSFYDEDGMNLRINYSTSDGSSGSVYLILGDDNVLEFYYVTSVNQYRYYSYFYFDYASSYIVYPVTRVYDEDDLILNTMSRIDVRSYDPDNSDLDVYDIGSGEFLTDEGPVELSQVLLNVSLDWYSDVLGYVMGFYLGDLGFEYYDQLGPYNPNLFDRADYDKDGELTIMDATRAQYMLADLVYTPEDIFLMGIDADADGELSIMDATRIQNVVAELTDIDGKKKTGR